MLQLAADLRLFVKAPQCLGIALSADEKHLEGQVAPQRWVVAAQHGAHPSTTNLTVDLEAPEPMARSGRACAA